MNDAEPTTTNQDAHTHTQHKTEDESEAALVNEVESWLHFFFYDFKLWCVGKSTEPFYLIYRQWNKAQKSKKKHELKD